VSHLINFAQNTYSYVYQQNVNRIILPHTMQASAVVRQTVFYARVLGSMPTDGTYFYYFRIYLMALIFTILVFT